MTNNDTIIQSSDECNNDKTLFFNAWFKEMTDFSPFRWQIRLFTDLVKGEIPSALDLPTGLGKTSVMTIWLLARAFNPALPRRLVYVVDRRAVVDQATEEAQKLRAALQKLPNLMEKLRVGRGGLPVSTLRGQLADNREWLSDPTSPAIIVGTIDMTGSRLLFEGYGVSRGMRPYHAGLLGADTLFVLDEAHLCPPFQALLDAIATDRALSPRDEEARELIPKFQLLPLSATGRNIDDRAFTLQPEDYQDNEVEKRLISKKCLSIELLEDGANLSKHLAEHAWELRGSNNRVLIYCHGRGDAKKVADELRKKLPKGKEESSIEMLTGARRIYERERLASRLKDCGFLSGLDKKRESPVFLVATSAGEVGIDLDADHMVCDIVAFERMVQRLGRVNRPGQSHQARA